MACSHQSVHQDIHKLYQINAKLIEMGNQKRLRSWYKVKKPIFELYRKNLNKFALQESKNIIKIVESKNVQKYLTHDFKSEDYRKFADSADFNERVSQIVYPVARYLGLMQVKQQAILKVLGNYAFKQTVDFTWQNAVNKGVKQNLSYIPPKQTINKLLEQHSYPACENTVKGYSRSVETIVRNGFSQGKKAKDITKDLKFWLNMEGPKKPDYIFERIAYNETTRFTNEGKFYAWEEMGVEFYDWIQGPGPCNKMKICRKHALGSPYRIREGPMPIDDTHVNCLCEIKEAGKGNPLMPGIPDYPNLPQDILTKAFQPKNIDDTVSKAIKTPASAEEVIESTSPLDKISEIVSPWDKGGEIVGPYTAWMSDDPKTLIKEANTIIIRLKNYGVI